MSTQYCRHLSARVPTRPDIELVEIFHNLVSRTLNSIKSWQGITRSSSDMVVPPLAQQPYFQEISACQENGNEQAWGQERLARSDCTYTELKGFEEGTR